MNKKEEKMNKIKNIIVDILLYFCGAGTILFLNFPVKWYGYLLTDDRLYRLIKFLF